MGSNLPLFRVIILLLITLLASSWASNSQKSLRLTTPSPCSGIEKAFANVAVQGEEPACRCHLTDFTNEVGQTADTSWIGCTHHKMPSVFRSLNSLDNDTTTSHLWIWDSLINILPSDMFGTLRPRTVTIENSQLGVIRSGAFGSIGSGLEALRLRNNILRALDDDVFAGLGELTKLDLSGNKLGELRSGHFADLGKLESLVLDGNQISHIAQGSFKSLRQLKTLSIAKNKLTEITRETFAGLESLEVLSLRGNTIERIERGAFSRMKRLRSIDLGDNRLTELDLDDLPLLEKIYLNNNSFTSLRHLRLSLLPSLQLIYVDRNRLEAIGDSDLAPLSGSHSLSHISLVANNITQIGCSAFEHVPHLRVLSLQNNAISTLSCPESREPILMRSVFHPLKRLERLFLSRNQINVVEDGHVNVLPALRELALDHNNISEIGKDALKGLGGLKKLFINSNRLYYLPEGVFDGWSVERIQSVDLSANQWECICGREWIGEWLAKLALANTPSSSLGCLLHNGVPFNCNATYADDEEAERHNVWITVIACIMALVAIAFLIAAGYVYLQDNCYQLRTLPTLRNLPPDMVRLIPSQESLLLSYPNPLHNGDGLLKTPRPPIPAISIRIDGECNRAGEPKDIEATGGNNGDKKRVRFDGM